MRFDFGDAKALQRWADKRLACMVCQVCREDRWHVTIEKRAIHIDVPDGRPLVEVEVIRAVCIECGYMLEFYAPNAKRWLDRQKERGER